MEPITSSYIAGIATNLTTNLLGALGRRVQTLLRQPPEHQAIQRCVNAGIVAVLETVSLHDKDTVNLLADICKEFFSDSDVAKELVVLLKGQKSDREELKYLFEQSGFDPETLPQVHFEHVVDLFETAFIFAASCEHPLQSIMQTHQLMQQTNLQEEMLNNLQQLVRILRQSNADTLQISSGKLTSRNIETQQVLEHQTVFHVEGSWITGGVSAENFIAGNVDTLIQADTYIDQRSRSQQSSANSESLRNAYLNRLFEETQGLSLTGIDPKAASDAQNRLHLDAVYTALLTHSLAESDRLSRGEALKKESRHLSALEQLNRHHRLVLLGDPGSGKSTFVNFVALCLTGEALNHRQANMELLTTPLPPENKNHDQDKNPVAQPWDHGPLLPIRVILRDFAARGLPDIGEKATAKHVGDFITNELVTANLADYDEPLRQELLTTGGLLLLDGLDEVPEAENRRTQIKEAIEDFVSVFNKCRVLITSRTYLCLSKARMEAT